MKSLGSLLALGLLAASSAAATPPGYRYQPHTSTVPVCAPSRAALLMGHHRAPTRPAPMTRFTWSARDRETAELMNRVLTDHPDAVGTVIGNIAVATRIGAPLDRERAWATLTWLAVNGTGRAQNLAIRFVSLDAEGARILTLTFESDRFLEARERQRRLDLISAAYESSRPAHLRRPPAAAIVIPPLPAGVEIENGRLVARNRAGEVALEALVARGSFDIGGNRETTGDRRLGIEATGRLILVGADGRTTPLEIMGMTATADGNAAILVRGAGSVGLFANQGGAIRAGVRGELFVGARAEAGGSITIPLLVIDLELGARGNVSFGAGVTADAGLQLRDENGNWAVGGRVGASATLGPGAGGEVSFAIRPGAIFRSTGPVLPRDPEADSLMGPRPRLPLVVPPRIEVPQIGPAPRRTSSAPAVLPFLAALGGSGVTPSVTEALAGPEAGGTTIHRYGATVPFAVTAAGSGTAREADGAGLERL